MRLSKLRLTNYRQFRDVELELRASGKSDIHVFVGSNGTGKTNLLNSLCWCLYGDEPHLTDESRGLPLLNLASLAEVPEGEAEQVSVEVSFETEGGGRYTFVREHTYRIHDGQPSLQASRFRASYPDASGNTKLAEGDEAAAYVERLVPEGIREYFFFDGERLDSYFKEEAGQRIGHAVFEIAQIDLLTTVERKLGDLLKDIQREAGRKSPAIEVIREELEGAEAKQEHWRTRLKECERQIRLAEAAAAEYADKLRSLPDVESLEKERGELDSEIESLGELVKEKEAEKGDLLFEYGILLNVQPALQRAVDTVEEKRRAGEIPPAVNRQLLEDSLAQGECAICGTKLVGPTEEQVRELLKDIELSSEVANELQRIEGPLRMLLGKAGSFEEDARRAARDIRGVRDRLARASKRRDEIENELSGFDVEKVRQWAESRRRFEDNAKRQREVRGALVLGFETAKREVEKLQNRLREALKAEKKVRGLQQQVALCSQAQQVAETAKERIVNVVRQQIEQRTNEIFMDLIWKRATYERVEIDESYNISLYHRAGYNALGSASAAERELLALSFTLALHEVSGFDAPLAIDTPVARVSDQHRENFARVLAEVGTRGKQTLLLFTPDEYTSSVSRWLEPAAASKHEFRLQGGEMETRLEDLSGA